MLINSDIKRIVGGCEIKEVRYMDSVVWSFKGPIITNFDDSRYFEKVNNRMKLKKEFHKGKVSFCYPLYDGSKYGLYNATSYNDQDITKVIAFNSVKNVINNKYIYLARMPLSNFDIDSIKFININPKYNIILMFIHEDGIYDLENEKEQAKNYFKEVII